jgi:hypothetical protein
MLRRKYKRIAYETAAYHWNKVNREHPDWSEDRKRAKVREAVEEQILHQRSSMGMKDGYGSLITSLLISLMIKFAFRLLDKWIQNRLLSVGAKYDG